MKPLAMNYVRWFDLFVLSNGSYIMALIYQSNYIARCNAGVRIIVIYPSSSKVNLTGIMVRGMF